MAHKITLVHKPEIKWLNEQKTHGIGGLTEPIELVLYLKDDEYENLKVHYNFNQKTNPNDVGTCAIYAFTHFRLCTPHHRRKIWKVFKGNNIQIKGL